MELSVEPDTARSVTVCGFPAGVTVMADVPDFPPLDAVMVAVPWATPVSRPAAVTEATEALLLVQVTVRPVSTLPAESLRVAVNCRVAPTSWLTDAGATVTEATEAAGAPTVRDAVPLTVPLDALIVAEPAARPVAV